MKKSVKIVIKKRKEKPGIKHLLKHSKIERNVNSTQRDRKRGKLRLAEKRSQDEGIRKIDRASTFIFISTNTIKTFIISPAPHSRRLFFSRDDVVSRQQNHFLFLIFITAQIFSYSFLTLPKEMGRPIRRFLSFFILNLNESLSFRRV
jgi:hypothetical protein